MLKSLEVEYLSISKKYDRGARKIITPHSLIIYLKLSEHN